MCICVYSLCNRVNCASPAAYRSDPIDPMKRDGRVNLQGSTNDMNIRKKAILSIFTYISPPFFSHRNTSSFSLNEGWRGKIIIRLTAGVYGRQENSVYVTAQHFHGGRCLTWRLYGDVDDGIFIAKSFYLQAIISILCMYERLRPRDVN